jgi:16S rRNA processing protein RimM
MTETEETTGAPRRVLLGHIAGAHGIRGAVLIKSYTDAPEDIDAYGPLQDEEGVRSFELESESVTPKGVIARIAGVDDRTAAEKLKGVALYVLRERLPEAEEGEYYHADLIGLDAVDPEGKAIGHVLQVHNFGAGDLLELRLSGQIRTEFVPMTEDVVREVDLAGGRIVIAMPESVEAVEDGDVSEDAGEADDTSEGGDSADGGGGGGD